MGAESSKGKKNEKNKISKRNLETIPSHEESINCMSVSSDREQSLLVTGSDDHTLKMYGIAGDETEPMGILQDSFVGHNMYVTCVTVYDIWIISGAADNTICKWDPIKNDCIFTYRGHRNRISRIMCTGDYIFSTSADKTAKAWFFDAENLDNEEEAEALVKNFEGHTKGVYPLIFIHGDKSFKVDEKAEPKIHKDDILITGSVDCTAKCWSFETGQVLMTYYGHHGSVTCMSVDGEEKILYTGSTDTIIRSFVITTGELLQEIFDHKGSIMSLVVVNRLMFTGDTTGSAYCTVREYGDVTREFRGHNMAIVSLIFNEGILYTASADMTVRAFDATSAVLKYVFRGHTGTITSMVIRGTKLYTGASDGFLMVWDISGLKPHVPIRRSSLFDRGRRSSNSSSSSSSSSSDSGSNHGNRPSSNRPSSNRPSSNRPSSNQPSSNRPSILLNDDIENGLCSM